MSEYVNKEDIDNGSDAASLAKIKVRKNKQETIEAGTSKKTGDITTRLAELSKELDAAMAEPSTNTSAHYDARQESQTHNHSTSSPERRLSQPNSSKKKSGWAVKEAAPDILSYWMDIRGPGRRYPSWESLEPEVIGKHWPNCVLVHCNREVGRLQVKYKFTHAIRKAAFGDSPEDGILGQIEFTPMIIDWVLSLGRDVANTRKPAHGTEYFPSTKGEFPLHVIALPLSETGRDIDHVLCCMQKLN